MSTNASAFDATAAFNSYFGFNRKPFPTRFDSEFFCSNPRYDIIYNYLLYGIRHHQGMMALTGEAGTGKTFMLRKLMQEADEGVTFISHNYFADVDFDDLLCIICEDLALATHSSSRLDELKALVEFLNSCFESGKSVALIIDEAHKLDDDILNHLFTLSNSGFKDGRSLQVLLSGLPLLGEKLTNCKTMHPLMVDISEKRLEPFTDTEVAAFIRHQLQIAGGPNKNLFPEAVLKSIACHVRVPRLINRFCDRALRLAQENKQAQISPELISELAEEILLSDADSYDPISSVGDSFPPATPRVSNIPKPIPGPSVKADVQALPRSDRALMPVTRNKPSVSHEVAGRIVVRPTETPKPPAMDSTDRRTHRWRNWAALSLIVSMGAAGSYALQQRYKFDEIAVEAKQALDVIDTQWASISPKIMSFAQALKSEPPWPPTAPESIHQDTPPLGPSGIPRPAVAEVQPAALPYEPRSNIKLISQPKPTLELVDTVDVVETPAPFEKVSDAAKQALEVIETQWSSLTSKMMANAQALKPDNHLPPPTPGIIQTTPAEPDIELADIASVELTPMADLPEIDDFLEAGIGVELNFLPSPGLEERSEHRAPEHAGSQTELQDEIERLLALAEASRLDYRLTTPAHDSAIYYYRRVLQLDSKNPDAKRGISKVVNAYQNLARVNLRSNQFDRARIFITRGLALAPQNPRLLALLKQVEREASNRPVSPPPDERINYSYSYGGEQGFNRK